MQSLAARRQQDPPLGGVIAFPQSAQLRDRCLAHDLKNLMTVVLSATETLALAEAEVDRRELANVSLEAARRGAAVLRDLLADYQPPKRPPAPTACKEILGAAARLGAQVLPTGVRLTMTPCPAQLQIAADREGLEAALLNLCKNAGEASCEGGAVTLSAAPVAAGAAYAIGLEPRPYVRFDVRDTGAGMTPAALARATRPGFSTKPGGQGLGLASVAEFAERQGGALRITSTLGEGCVASLYLPRAAALPGGPA